VGTHAIIVSAGKGKRMNRATPKQYLLLQGVPILGHTVLAFDHCALVDQIILVVPETDIAFCRDQLLPDLKIETPVQILAGGKRRQDSAYNGILSIDDTSGIVIIHDGVRPLIQPRLISRCIQKAETQGACVAGIPLHDTLKSVVNENQIRQTILRDGLWLAQTPQTFQYRLILGAHETALRDGFEATDDASLVERLGIPVSMIMGSTYNFKITTQEDLVLANAFFSK